MADEEQVDEARALYLALAAADRGRRRPALCGGHQGAAHPYGLRAGPPRPPRLPLPTDGRRGHEGSGRALRPQPFRMMAARTRRGACGSRSTASPLRPSRARRRGGAAGGRRSGARRRQGRRAARALLRHGRVPRLPRDGRRARRPARLHDQGAGRHARSAASRRCPDIGSGRARLACRAAGRHPGDGDSTSWWSAPARPGSRRPRAPGAAGARCWSSTSVPRPAASITSSPRRPPPERRPTGRPARART